MFDEEENSVKKIVSILLALVLLMTCASAMAAAKKTTTMADNNFSMETEGYVVLQNVEDRKITPAEGALEVNPVIDGESPTTGMPYDTSARYMPIIVQISNSAGTETVEGGLSYTANEKMARGLELDRNDTKDKKIESAGIGPRAPWGGQYADVVYEGILYRDGVTRISFVYNDALADGGELTAGPVRSARLGHVRLREEWGGGIAFCGGPKAESNNVIKLFKDLGATDKGVVFDVETSLKKGLFNHRVKGVLAPDNLSVDAVGLQSLIPETTVATPHPFLFSDVSPYTDGYEMAYSINLDWGHNGFISHYVYDAENNLYLRYSGEAPYMTFAAADDREEDNMEQLSFSNVIIQRVPYKFVNNNRIMPDMQSIGKGNADIFIGGRYIPGYWVREDLESPTVYFDDQGNEIYLARGKTFIAHFPPEALLAYGN